MKEKILSMLREIPGKTGFYYKDLITGEEWGLNADRELMAASVIKIPVLTEVFAQLAAGTADKNERFRIRKEDKLPSCGALNYLHEGLEVTLEERQHRHEPADSKVRHGSREPPHARARP